ncbi:MAG: ATP-binding cassette domain-containing protein, partial [Bacteroidales bacterium]|nr:ATP-binding cassette domain-containing protein [Bacteroidales bacterium]
MKEKDSRNPLFIIPGENFSGRSEFLKSLVSHNDDKPYSFLYLGELPSNYITGIFPTVTDEINLHRSKATNSTSEKVDKLFATYKFDKHLAKNPFTLSGGEQVILAILNSLLLEPSTLAIDITLEQLSNEWREPLLNAIQQGMFNNSDIYLADNRMNEYELNNYSVLQPTLKEQNHKWKFLPASMDYSLEKEETAAVIQLKDLSFSYQKNDSILEKINLELQPREIYHLKGPNGVGKSTFAKILTGILQINKKQLWVDGKEFNSYKYPGKLVGYSFQNPDEQLFSSSVEKEVLRPLKNETEEYSKRREKFIRMFGLENIRKAHPAELPFAMRKRIALAATLAMDRPWYILDEPTLG